MKLILTSLSKLSGDWVTVGVFARRTGPLPLTGPLRRAFASADIKGKSGERFDRSASGSLPAASLQGLGRSNDFDAGRLDCWLAQIVAEARRRGLGKVAIVLPTHECTEGRLGLERVVAGLEAADYQFDDFKEKATRRNLTLRLVPPPSEESTYRENLAGARALAAARSFSRTLGNTPPNVATPEWMAEQATSLAESRSLKAQVLAPKQLQKKAMGGILAVGQGSVNEPRLVRLSYGTEGPKVALVGKGVTFDTGGISIKPSASMEDMKYDKCGSCAVLGITQAVADLELPIQLESYLPFAENMPDGKAYRPGDIVKCYSGKTVEILNTDAEGRMLLADALAWATEKKPDYLVDYATLTGACVVALGEGAAALYARDQDMGAAMLSAAASVQERLWPMPLWPEFVDQMKGQHADLKNSGGRWGGSNTAAAFLSQFVGDHPRWAHIDLAGPAYTSAKTASRAAGATGYGVALTVEWLRGLS